MAISPGYKAITEAWANAAPGSRTDPDDPGLMPPIDIADGYPASFSAVGGDTPRRNVINEVYYRRDSGLLDIRKYGILPWDTDVDTLQGGVKQVNGVVYKALVDNGPTYGNAVSPTTTGQTVWEGVSGTLNTPGTPDMPTAVASNGRLVWTWNCPLDGGAAIDHFDFEWREAGGSFTQVEVAIPYYELTGLTNNTTYEVQVRANNAQGDGSYSAVGTGTPVASVPDGGNSFGLRAAAGDASGEIDIEWFAPPNNGATITEYTYQWKSGSQSYSTGRQGISTGTTATVTALTDGTEYDFRVRATNSAGNSPWSNEDSATPEAPPSPPPADAAPDAPTNLMGESSDLGGIQWTWEVGSDNGEVHTGFDFQWRESGDSWSQGTVVDVTEACYFPANRNYRCRHDHRGAGPRLVIQLERARRGQRPRVRIWEKIEW